MGYSNWSTGNSFTTKTTYGISGLEQAVFHGESNYQFHGCSVSINGIGDTVAIGAYGWAANSGYVKVYKLISGTWGQIGNGLYGQTWAGTKFGWAVSINSTGDVIAIGEKSIGSDTGRVNVFKYISNAWIRVGEAYQMQGEAYSDYFGCSVSINNAGDIVVVGASNANSSTGYVKIYKLVSDVWTLQGAKLTGEANGGEFGCSVSINGLGDIIAIGAYRANNAKGYVEIYKNISGTWTLQGTRLLGEAVNDNFGYSVSINDLGDIVVIGAFYANSYTGYVKVYKFISGTWIQQGTRIDGNAENAYFGKSVSINDAGDIIAIGAPNSYDYRGSVKIYKFASDSWVQQGITIIGAQYVGSVDLGNSVSLNSAGDTIAIGAQQNNAATGYVKIYK
jgi:hypothetical protein